MAIFKEFNLANVIIMALFGIVGIQAISFLLTQIFKIPLLKTGPIFYMFALAIGVGVGFTIVARGIKGTKFEKIDFLIFGVALVIAAVFLFYAKNLVPAIFSSANIELQSLIGLGT